jgi:integrase
MNLAYDYQLTVDPNCGKIAEMRAFLEGAYWENDFWRASNPFFDKYSAENANRPNLHWIDFSEFPVFKLESKYFLARMLSARAIQLSTICTVHKRSFRLLTRFLDEFYPEIRSFADIRFKEAKEKWIAHLGSEGYKILYFKSLANQLHSFFTDFYDDRDEYDKDIWDWRKIPDIIIPANIANFKISFTSVPSAFRDVARKYVKLRLATGSIPCIRRELVSITQFLTFIAKKEPSWTSLKKLTRRHIEDFLTSCSGDFNTKTDLALAKLSDIRAFLQHIQESGSLDAEGSLIPDLPATSSGDCLRLPGSSPIDYAHENSAFDYGKQAKMVEFLRDTYWDNDIWDVKNQFFDEYHTGTDSNCTVRRIDFSSFPELFRLEVKYYYAIRISNNTLHPRTCKGNQYTIRQFLRFSNELYPDIRTFSDARIKVAIAQWFEQLEHDGCKKPKDGTRSILIQLHSFFSDFFDTRDEYDKEIWDCRKIPGITIPVNATKYRLNFTTVPSVFRRLAQRYIKLRLTTNSIAQAYRELSSISVLLQFIAEKEPQWADLRALTRGHIEEFLVAYLSKHSIVTKGVNEKLLCARHFLLRIQQFGYPEAPLAPASSLFFHEDIPRAVELPPMSERIKYIPEGVMEQLKEHLEHLMPSEYIPVIILLMISGWRASDVLALKYDNCLEHTEQGWYLKGDIPKVRKIDHRIPITEDEKAVVESFAEIAKSKSTDTNNPKHLLFNRYHGLRIGRSLFNRQVQSALNRFAEQYNITDSVGKVYYFKLHAFRHTKGVELINNGMSLIHVQKWMAHVSPEMTLVYAKVLDTTLRKSWEQAVKNGLFRITPSGHVKKIDISSITDEDLIEWEYIRHNLDAVRMPLGFCLKPKKQDCFTQLNPCLTCRNLCTTPDFLPQFEVEIRETKILIERGKAQGREIWVEKNQHLLERYEEIVTILKEGHTRHIAGKKGREYIGEERDDAQKPSSPQC